MFYERQELYENLMDLSFSPLLPIVVRANGKNFKRLTRNIIKPYCPEFGNIMQQTMLQTSMELEGTVFAYQSNDEMSFVFRGLEDGGMPYGNKVQKLISVVAGQTAISFLKNYMASDDPPDIIGEALFDCKGFALPSVEEALNYFIFKQKEYYITAINNAAEAELTKVHGKKATDNILFKRKTSERLELLSQLGIDFNETYPKEYYIGTCSYKIPRVAKTEQGNIIRKKWILDNKVINFEQEGQFLINILEKGYDHLEPSRDIL